MKEDSLFEAVKTAFKAIEDKFGKDISVLKINKVSILADYFIIATGNSGSQLRSMADELERRLEERGIKLRHIEDFKGSKWVLLDFGVIIVHLFNGEEREFYNLDAIWRDAEVISMGDAQ